MDLDTNLVGNDRDKKTKEGTVKEGWNSSSNIKMGRAWKGLDKETSLVLGTGDIMT